MTASFHVGCQTNVLCEVCRRWSVEAVVCQNAETECYPSWNPQPVKLVEKRSDALRTPDGEYKSSNIYIIDEILLFTFEIAHLACSLTSQISRNLGAHDAFVWHVVVIFIILTSSRTRPPVTAGGGGGVARRSGLKYSAGRKNIKGTKCRAVKPVQTSC